MARIHNDNYPTDSRLARLICERLAEDGMNPSTILEPSCGAGTFMKAAAGVWPKASIMGLEIDRDLAHQARQVGFRVKRCDSLAVDRAKLGKFDLVLGNPPYRYAERFVRRFRRCVEPSGGLVYLLRLNFLGGQKRYERLWSQWAPRRVYVLPKRPGFKGDGKTDMTEYGVFWWARKASTTEISWVDNRNL